MRIAVCTLAINEWYAEIVHYGLKTLQLYCQRHNYDYYCPNEVYDGKRECPWYKILAIQKIISDYDYVVWIDADGFIFNQSIRIEQLIDRHMTETDLLCSKDEQGVLNTGLMILRNNAFIAALLTLTWYNNEPFDCQYHEQASLAQLYTHNRLNCQSRIKILPIGQRDELFSYWSEFDPAKTFYIHLARCSHEPVMFMVSMDHFCPIKMTDDTDEEFAWRQGWLNNPELCRNEIERWQKGLPAEYISTRSIRYARKMNYCFDDKPSA